MRRGTSDGVSIGIGMAIFVTSIATAFLLLQGSVYTGDQFSAQVDAAAQDVRSGFRAATMWDVHRMPVMLYAPTAATNAPFELSVPIPAAADPESVVLLHDGQEVVSQYDPATNDTVFVTNLSQGTNTVYASYVTTDALPEREYTTALSTDGNRVWNDRINLTVADDGLDSFRYNGEQFFTATADIGTSSTPQVSEELVRANVSYDGSDTTAVTLYDRSQQVRLQQWFSGSKQWTFELTSNFTDMYTEDAGEQSLGTTGTIYSGETDFIDFYDSTGFAIIGENLSVDVERSTATGPIDVTVTVTDSDGAKEALLYPHDGDYTVAQPQHTLFFTPVTSRIGMPVSRTGVSRQQADDLAAQDYDDVKTAFGVTGSEFNITVSDVLTHGTDILSDAAVRVYAFPVPVVERFGNASIETMELRVWVQ